MQEREYDVTTTQGKTTLWVDSDRIDNCLSYFREHHIDSLGVNPVRGYRLNHLDFLQRCTDLVSLQIVFAPSFKFDLSPLMAVVGLESLTLSTDVPLLLDHFPRLKEFRGIWHPKLQLSGCPKLQTLNILQLPELEVLDVEKCRRLRGHDVVRSLNNLRVLRFNDCGEIPNLKFIEEMPKLEEFRFVNTNVLDGNLEPLFRLKRVGFLPTKHYSHTPQELDAILRPRGGSAIPTVV